MKLETLQDFNLTHSLHCWAVTNVAKKEWKDTVPNSTNVTEENEGNTESNISTMAETIFKRIYKEIRNIINK